MTKNFSIGNDIQPRRDLTRYVKWPKYVTLQRKKAILLKRLKVPPVLNQFTNTLNTNQAQQLFSLLRKYKATEGAADAKGKVQRKLRYGLNEVTSLIEKKKAKMVVIAHDVDPIELVVWLPTLCRRKEVPYCIVKGKARLGQLTGRKKASVVCLTDVSKEDKTALETMQATFKSQYNDNVDMRRRWGGGHLGRKSMDKKLKHERAVAAEAAKKIGMQA